MRFQIDEQYGDPEVLRSAEEAETFAAPAPDEASSDPTAPDLSYLDEIIASYKQGSPQDLHEALGSFLGTFNRVVMDNPTNRVEPTSLLRLKELVDLVKAGELPPDNPELQSLGAAAKRHGKAVGAVYKFFLFFDPYGCFAQIRNSGLKVFQPLLGPILAVEGDTVRDILMRHQDFTVDPYGVEMKKTMTPEFNGPNGGTGLSNFILGTDEDAVYEPDKRLLTSVVNAQDPKRIRPALHSDCFRRMGRAVQVARDRGTLTFDVVGSVARFVPVTMGRVYLGVPSEERIQQFELTDDMLKYYGEDLLGGPDGKQVLSGTGLKKEDGMVADEDTMYQWIKSAFEGFFNNVPKNVSVQQAGFRSCRLLLCCILREIEGLKNQLREGAQLAPSGREPKKGQIRNTVLSRLVALQLKGDLPEQLVTDLRIAENVMGTVVGAVAGQEEATCRVIDSLLKLKENVYKRSSSRRMRGSFEDARRRALVAASRRSSWLAKYLARKRLFHYFRECLRMEPQGELLLRQCKADGTRLFDSEQTPSEPALSAFAGNRPIRAGELIFAAHGSAMKDVQAADEFRLKRPDAEQTYLFYGHGRHRCLGQYISPVIIVETMISVLVLDGLNRASDFELDDKNLYARKLMVEFADTGSTQRFYPAS